MTDKWFGIHNGLVAAGRIPAVLRIQERISAMEMMLLFLCGIAAAVSSCLLHHGLRLPGSSIVFSLIPMAFGLALAPRRNAGCIMGAGALSAAVLFNITGFAHSGAGAFVSLCLLGPVMDLALAKASKGWRLYFGLMLAGIVTNLFALASRSVSKLLGFDVGGMRPFGSWWAEAIVTYIACGAVAGLIAAVCFFHLHKQQSGNDAAGTTL
jgi:hypothetical protein